MRDTPEWRNWQTRLTQNQVLRSVGSSPTSGTNAQAAGKFEAFPPLFAYPQYTDAATMKTQEETQETAAQP